MPSCGVCVSVRLSVSLSATFVHWVETNEHILKLFITVGWPHRSSFSVPNLMPVFRRGRDVKKCRGYEKIAIFDQYLALSRKWYKTGPYLLWNANRKSYVIYRMLPFWMTLSDLESLSQIISDDALRGLLSWFRFAHHCMLLLVPWCSCWGWLLFSHHHSRNGCNDLVITDTLWIIRTHSQSVVRATTQVNGESQNLTPHRAQTP